MIVSLSKSLSLTRNTVQSYTVYIDRSLMLHTVCPYAHVHASSVCPVLTVQTYITYRNTYRHTDIHASQALTYTKLKKIQTATPLVQESKGVGRFFWALRPFSLGETASSASTAPKPGPLLTVVFRIIHNGGVAAFNGVFAPFCTTAILLERAQAPRTAIFHAARTFKKSRKLLNNSENVAPRR